MPVAAFIVLVVVTVIMVVRFGVRGRLVVRVMTLHGAMLTGCREGIGSVSRSQAMRCNEVAPRVTSIRADQHLHMLAHAAREGTERVTAFERGHNASA